MVEINSFQDLNDEMNRALSDRKEEVIKALDYAVSQIQEAKKTVQSGGKVCASNLIGNIAINLSSVDYYLADYSSALIAKTAFCINEGDKIK